MAKLRRLGPGQYALVGKKKDAASKRAIAERAAEQELEILGLERAVLLRGMKLHIPAAPQPVESLEESRKKLDMLMMANTAKPFRLPGHYGAAAREQDVIDALAKIVQKKLLKDLLPNPRRKR